MPSKTNKTTIRDIAEACGVTIATVSRAINNQPGMREEVRRNILQYISNIGWRSNNLKQRFAGSHQDGKLRHVLCLSNIWDLNFGGLRPMHCALTQLIGELEKNDVTVSVSYGSQVEALRKYNEFNPDAILILGGDNALSKEVTKLKKHAPDLKMITAFNECSGTGCPAIHSDHVLMGIEAARVFKEKGHHSFGLFAPMGMMSHPVDFLRVLSPRYREMVTGILSECPDFDPERDIVSDNYWNPEEFIRMFRSGRYDSWLCIGREAFDLYCDCCLAYKHSRHGDPFMLPILMESSPFDPVVRFDRFHEPSEHVAELIMQLLYSQDSPSMEYRLPYIRKDAVTFETRLANIASRQCSETSV